MPRILVAEDNAVNLELTTALLEVAGCAVLTVETGAEGIRLAVEAQPDLIVLDIRLPDMSGYDAARCLKADPRTAWIPLMAFTAHAMRGEEERAFAAGCDAYLTKPVDTECFHESVRRLLEASSAARARVVPGAGTGGG
jgi:two-component system, cell cycle response regulator DivK